MQFKRILRVNSIFVTSNLWLYIYVILLLLPRNLMPEVSHDYVQLLIRCLQLCLSSTVLKFSASRMSAISLISSIHLVGNLPLDHFPSTFPWTTSFSRLVWSLRIICPKYRKIRLRHVVDSQSVIPSSFRIEMLVLLAVHGMRSIRRQHHISKASIRRLSAWSSMTSHLIQKIEKTRVRTKAILFTVICQSVQII